LVDPQRGHELRAAVPSVQAEARRLRVLDLEVFFFGTAIVVSSEERALRQARATREC
jgi:hypothetical protein